MFVVYINEFVKVLFENGGPENGGPENDGIKRIKGCQLSVQDRKMRSELNIKINSR